MAPLLYSDRLRIRHPGDTSFALGPHMDGGSLERWEPSGYGGLNGTYASIFSGDWESYDPWDIGARLNAVMDLYGGVGNCSALRTQQGWLSMSRIKGGEGHLQVQPLLREATAYLLLRPFFEAKRVREQCGSEDEFLASRNWRLEVETSVCLTSLYHCLSRLKFRSNHFTVLSSRRFSRSRSISPPQLAPTSPSPKYHGLHAARITRRLCNLALRHRPRRR